MYYFYCHRFNHKKMDKQTIINHLNKNGNFFIIGKNSYNIAQKIVNLHNGKNSIFHNFNKLPEKAKHTFNSLLYKNQVVIGTIEKEINIPTIIKQCCMIMRLKK